MGWLAKMRGKSPSEVLGEVATSGLFKSLIQSTILIALIIGVWTAGAWGYEEFVKKDAVAETAPATDPTTSNEKETSEPEETTIPDNVADPNKAAMPDLTNDSKKAAADKMGVNEVKSAPSNVNPLESSADDLLKDLE